jgi:integrase
MNMHGLRKLMLSRLAEAGLSEDELMAWSTHTSPTMLRVYLRTASQERMANSGMAKLLSLQSRGQKRPASA